VLEEEDLEVSISRQATSTRSSMPMAAVAFLQVCSPCIVATMVEIFRIASGSSKRVRHAQGFSTSSSPIKARTSMPVAALVMVIFRPCILATKTRIIRIASGYSKRVRRDQGCTISKRPIKVHTYTHMAALLPARFLLCIAVRKLVTFQIASGSSIRLSQRSVPHRTPPDILWRRPNPRQTTRRGIRQKDRRRFQPRARQRHRRLVQRRNRLLARRRLQQKKRQEK
jgi:hypothetical protein